MSCNALSHPCPSHSRRADGFSSIAAGRSVANLTGFAIALVLLGLVVLGEIWTIEHAPELIESCNSALSSDASPTDACSRIESPVATIY